MSLIKEVYDGKTVAADAELDKLANTVASQSTGKKSSEEDTPSDNPPATS